MKPGPYVVLTVTDTGTGMTPEVQARLFEPFFTTKERRQRHRARPGDRPRHRRAERRERRRLQRSRQGHVVQGVFPAGRMPRRRSSTRRRRCRGRAPGRRRCSSSRTQTGFASWRRRLLERQGYTVLVAANADEALRLFEQNASIDVLLTDVVMPGASGPELTRQLVERRPALKVIYMSGYTEDAIVQHGVLNPGIAFLHKPFTSDTLGRKIREALDR